MRIEFSTEVSRYHCPKCGMRVSGEAVESAPFNALFVCDCGWQGDSDDLLVKQFTVRGLDALRAVTPASPRPH